MNWLDLPEELLCEISKTTRESALLHTFIRLHKKIEQKKKNELYRYSGVYPYNIIEQVALNPSLPLRTIKNLAKNEDWLVRCGIVKNLSTPPSILRILAQDTDPDVVEEVLRRPDVPVGILYDVFKNDKHINYVPFIFTIAHNPSTPVDLLLELSKYKDWEIREAAVSNESMPYWALDKVSRRSRCLTTKSAIIFHKNVSNDTLLRLSKSKYIEIQKKVQGALELNRIARG